MTGIFKFDSSNYKPIRAYCDMWEKDINMFGVFKNGGSDLVRLDPNEIPGYREVKERLAELKRLDDDTLGYRRMMVTDLGSGLIKPHQPRTSVDRTLGERVEESLIKVCIASLKDKVRKEYKEKLAQALAHIKDIRNAKCYQNNEGTGLVVEFETSKLTIELGEDAFCFDIEAYYSEIDSHLREPVRKVVELYNKDRIAHLEIMYNYNPESQVELILVVQFHGDDVPPARHKL